MIVLPYGDRHVIGGDSDGGAGLDHDAQQYVNQAIATNCRLLLTSSRDTAFAGESLQQSQPVSVAIWSTMSWRLVDSAMSLSATWYATQRHPASWCRRRLPS